MKRLIIFALAVFAVGATAVAEKKIPHAVRTFNEVSGRRTEIVLPQVKGFNCYKGDFHIHTSYSDGRVNPAGRVVEAWMDGLDIIAITDHYEGRRGEQNFFKVIAPYNANVKYQSAKKANCVKADFNSIHQEAVNQLEKSGFPMLLIKGCEMARNAETHGHFNALFLSDLNDLYNEDLAEAFRKVKAQGGIVVHNHPAWRRKTSDKTEFHEQVYGEGLVDGVEVVNGTGFYPQIVRRCIDEGLTMFANTDEHSLTEYRYGAVDRFRTMTFVLANELTEESIKEAILAHRTIAYSCGVLIGEQMWLSEFLNAALDCSLVRTTEEERMFRITNNCSIAMTLRLGHRTYLIEPFKSALINVGKDKASGEYLAPVFEVDNMWHIDYQHPKIELQIDK